MYQSIYKGASEMLSSTTISDQKIMGYLQAGEDVFKVVRPI
jgi:hypothetical protein